ncbi:MAG: hypothetical protein WDN02_10970 [Methylovirgula sp.]|uniref:hypothetical protein n=1 Tax=Methylovirgula sp. TaxID=1978224 RepID=UPI0030765698
MTMRMRGAFIAAAMVAASFCPPAKAEVPASVANTPAMQALLNTPDFRAAMMAAHRGDQRQAAAYLRRAAAKGNDLATLLLARMYFAGLGVTKNYNETLRLVRAVLVKHREPEYDIALDCLNQIFNQVKNSRNPQDQQMALAISVLPIAAAMPKHAETSGGGAASGSDYWGHRAFDEMTDHEFDPFDSGD